MLDRRDILLLNRKDQVVYVVEDPDPEVLPVGMPNGLGEVLEKGPRGRRGYLGTGADGGGIATMTLETAVGTGTTGEGM